MTNISKYHSVKVISAVMGFIVLSELAVAQDMGKNDSVSVRTEKTDMPYKVKGRIIDAVTKKGFAGARKARCGGVSKIEGPRKSS